MRCPAQILTYHANFGEAKLKENEGIWLDESLCQTSLKKLHQQHKFFDMERVNELGSLKKIL